MNTQHAILTGLALLVCSCSDQSNVYLLFEDDAEPTDNPTDNTSEQRTAPSTEQGTETTAGTEQLNQQATAASPRLPTGPIVPYRPLPDDLDLNRTPAPEELALQAQLTESQTLDADGLRARYALSHTESLSYVPREAEFMSKLQASALSLNEQELEVLDTHGFVIAARQTSSTFLHGYQSIYMEHLPVYISADSMLHAVHSSYDSILKDLEVTVLASQLHSLLQELRRGVSDLPVRQSVKNSVALYLDVAFGLLTEELPPNQPEVAALVARAQAATGTAKVVLFGTQREMDFSQFTPRGHYVGLLAPYFQSMMWLGRIDLRFFETGSNGSIHFSREQYEALLAIGLLFTPEQLKRWQRIDSAIQVFVGESDSMTVPQVAQLAETMGGYQAALAASDAEAAEALALGDYGIQRIASHLMTNDGKVTTLPLNRSFLLFGQRYTADSQVLSEVVHGRVARRMMPRGLDAAFGALGNSQALSALGEELDQYPGYAGALGRTRQLVDAHGEKFWQSSLYRLWSGALRSLSPAADLNDPLALGLPPLMASEAWGRRLLNTQLGSWAQLRHDTLLYAKQSYTSGVICDFPDAYVEPYPDFFDALVRYAELGGTLLEKLAASANAEQPVQPLVSEITAKIAQHFDSLRNAAATLGDMARAQRAGEPHTQEQLEFINEAVKIRSEMCSGNVSGSGWYTDLFYDLQSAHDADPTIADVHTQSTDAEGNRVGNVLHVGTGLPRLMVVTVDTCMGPRAYTGLAYSYHEQILPSFQRLNDQQWSEGYIAGGKAKELPWAQSFIAD